MKIIKKIKMPKKEKTALVEWLDEFSTFRLPCEDLKCSGIPCDDCPLDKICALKTKMMEETSKLLDTIEIEETDEKN